MYLTTRQHIFLNSWLPIEGNVKHSIRIQISETHTYLPHQGAQRRPRYAMYICYVCNVYCVTLVWEEETSTSGNATAGKGDSLRNLVNLFATIKFVLVPKNKKNAKADAMQTN